MLTALNKLSDRYLDHLELHHSRTLGSFTQEPSLRRTARAIPNISSQFDDRPAREPQRTRYRPSATSRRRRFCGKPLFGGEGKLTIGLTLHRHERSSVKESSVVARTTDVAVYILPRGSGGRTPAGDFQFDLHVGYVHKLTQTVAMNLFVDVVNLFS